MRIINRKEIFPTICISYTIISVGVHVFEMLCGFGEQNTHLNALFMLYCTIVGVVVLSMHYLFEEVSTIVIILVQYIVAIGLVLGSMFVLSFFIAVDTHGYFEMWRSFSIIYVLGAISYYVSLYIEINKQNNLLNEIKLNDLERKRN